MVVRVLNRLINIPDYKEHIMIRITTTTSTAVHELRLMEPLPREITIPQVVETVLKDLSNGKLGELKETRLEYIKTVLKMVMLSPKGSKILKEDAKWCLANIVDIQ